MIKNNLNLVKEFLQINEAWQTSWNNWHNTGKNLAELIAHYLVDDNSVTKQDYYCVTEPYFIDSNGISHYAPEFGLDDWESIIDVATALVNGELDSVIPDNPDRTDNPEAAARNILMAAACFDPGYKKTASNSGSLRQTGYGVIWCLGTTTNLSDDWQDIYEYFSDSSIRNMPEQDKKSLYDVVRQLTTKFTAEKSEREQKYESLRDDFFKVIPDIIKFKDNVRWLNGMPTSLINFIDQHRASINIAYEFANQLNLDKILKSNLTVFNNLLGAKGTTDQKEKARKAFLEFCKELSPSYIDTLYDKACTREVEMELEREQRRRQEEENRRRAEQEAQARADKEKEEARERARERDTELVHKWLQFYFSTKKEYEALKDKKTTTMDSNGTIHAKLNGGVTKILPKPGSVEDFIQTRRNKAPDFSLTDEEVEQIIKEVLQQQ